MSPARPSPSSLSAVSRIDHPARASECAEGRLRSQLEQTLRQVPRLIGSSLGTVKRQGEEKIMKLRSSALWFFASILTIGLLALSADSQNSDVQRALDSIQPFEAYSYCKILSSEKFAGRLTGHEGYTAAAEWGASKFREWGLRPFSKEAGYLQPYPPPYVIIDQAEMTLFLEEKPEGAKEATIKELKLEPEKEFLPLLFSDSGDHTGDLVFAGWGISASELGYG